MGLDIIPRIGAPKLDTPGFFGGDSGITYEELQARKKIARELMGGNGQIRNVGEGINSAAGSIAGAMMKRRADKEETKQRDAFNESFNSVVPGLFGGGYSAPMTGTASTKTPDASAPVNVGPGQGGGYESAPPPAAGGYADAIASVESAGSGDYSAVGPKTPKGRAYGRYQVMDFNIGPWTEKYLGRRMTPEEFLASPEAQDAVFNGEFGGYVQKYGNPQDAASMWFSGRPMAEAGNASDGYTTVPEYVEKFSGALGQPRMSTQGIRTAQAGGIDPAVIQQLAQLAGSPYASPGQKAIVGALLQQQLQAMQPQKPNYDFIKGVGVVDMNNPPPGMMAGRYQPVDDPSADGVQSSDILPNGTVVTVSRGGDVNVQTADGQPLEGQAAIDAIEEGRRMAAEFERDKYYSRREGQNAAEADTGAAAAAAGKAGEQAIEFSGEAYAGATALGSSTATIYEAVDALDRGGKAGAIDKFIPSITEASASLQNAMDRMGLDVISATTFGALSEGELKLAMETAVPRNLDEPQLREWLVRKAEANRKAQAMLLDAAVFFGTPGNTLQGWIEKNRASIESGPPPAPPDGSAPTVVPPASAPAPAQPQAAPAPPAANITFEQFSKDPSAIAAAEKFGVTLEEMWAVRNRGN